MNSSKIKNVIILFFAILNFALFPFEGGAQMFFNDFEDMYDTSGIWINSSLKDTVFSLSGKYSAFADSVNPYGAGVVSSFPKKIKGNNCFLMVSGYALTEDSTTDAFYVVTIVKEGKNILWKGISLSGKKFFNNKWTFFQDSIKIPASITTNAVVKAYLWNAARKNKIFLDNLLLSFNQIDNPCFIDDVKSIKPDTCKSVLLTDTLFSNDYYFFKSTVSGPVLFDNNGEILASGFSLFINDNDKFTENIIFGKAAVNNKKNTTVISCKFKNRIIKGKVMFICNKNLPEIYVKTYVKFKEEINPERIALLFNYNKPLKYVYKYTRKSDVENFGNEYWLDKEGVTTGDEFSGLTLYHNEELSSVQLDTKNKMLILNMDYVNDHHYLRFPLIADTFDVKVDLSRSEYKKHEKKEWSFKMVAGKKYRSIPVFMKNPYGFLATYIWTEHADWTDIRTHRAAYFGSDNITTADSATGGFVNYNIPVTKSVFFDNPNDISNLEGSDSLFNSSEESIKSDSLFTDFLFQIKSFGNEICLHTPDHYTTTYEILDESLKYMSENFGSATWIDHGYNNLPENNREDFVCDGVENFAAGLWKKYGIKYFWTPYYEDYNLYSGWSFNSSLEKVYSGFGDFFPRPDYWLHPTVTGSFYHWPTNSVLYIENDNLWSYYFSDNRLKDFVENWSLEINHCYPAWTLPGKGFWRYADDGAIVAMNGFNNTLSKMAALRKQGLLNVTTVGDYLDYRTSVDKLDYEFLVDGRVKITNSSGRDLKGLSFNVRASDVVVNDLKPATKRIGDYLIFWFDLKNGESKIIRWIN